jgi:hypothetical protein
MPITNNNLKMIDRPVWEQLTNTPANTANGVAMVDDNSRFIYMLFSATAFWRYDTWADTWQQLANPPGGTLAAGSCLRYASGMGGQVNGEVFGSVYALIASGTAVVFYRYDIATNGWGGALSVVNVPAAFGTDGRLLYPEPALNNWQGGYHGATSLCTVTASAQANAGATTISVNALPLALPIGTVLNFGTTAAPVLAVLTAAAAAAAVSITVAALVATVPSAAVAYWYADIYLLGNNGTVVYRYNIASNAWVLTSSNSGTPAIPAVTGSVAAGCVWAWLPGSGETNALNTLVLVRGGAQANIYEYRLDTNAWSALTFYPQTETFGGGTSSGVMRDALGRPSKLLLQKDATGRVYEFDRKRLRMEPKATQNLIAQGAAVVGDKMAVLRDPSAGIDFMFNVINTGSYFLRSPLFF